MLFPGLGNDDQLHALAVAENNEVNWLADFHSIHGIGIVIDVFDLLPAEFHDDVTPFDAGLLGGPSATHAAEFDAFNFCRVIRDGAEIGAQLIAPSSWSFDMGDFLVIGTFLSHEQILDDSAGKFRN